MCVCVCMYVCMTTPHSSVAIGNIINSVAMKDIPNDYNYEVVELQHNDSAISLVYP